MSGMDMNKMLKQVQQMQAQMQKAQEEADDRAVEATGGGMVKIVKATGGGEMSEIKIDPQGRSTRTTPKCSRTSCSPL